MVIHPFQARGDVALLTPSADVRESKILSFLATASPTKSELVAGHDQAIKSLLAEQVNREFNVRFDFNFHTPTL